MSVTATNPPRNQHERRAAENGYVLAFPIGEVPQRLGISRTKAYEEIAAGRLRAVKCGSRTLIPYASGEAWLASLPTLTV
jgi:excisionase family DNA binding protein